MTLNTQMNQQTDTTVADWLTLTPFIVTGQSVVRFLFVFLLLRHISLRPYHRPHGDDIVISRHRAGSAATIQFEVASVIPLCQRHVYLKHCNILLLYG
jgi:hypothetical protein